MGTREAVSLSNVSRRHMDAMAAAHAFSLGDLQALARVAAAQPYPWTDDHTEPFHAIQENVTQGYIATTTLAYLAALFGNALQVLAPPQYFYFSDAVLPECTLRGQPDAVVLSPGAELEPPAVLLSIELKKGPLAAGSNRLRKARYQTYATQVISDSLAYRTG